MGAILDKFKNMMLGTDYEDDSYDDDDYDDQLEREALAHEEEEPLRGHARNTPKNRTTELDLAASRKTSKNSNVINFQNAQATAKMNLVITYPTDVREAAAVCDHVKENKACIINLEGVDVANAQRIADFLGGAIYVIDGEIQRISNEIFVIAPATVHIDDLKEQLTGVGSHLSWASSFK